MRQKLNQSDIKAEEIPAFTKEEISKFSQMGYYEIAFEVGFNDPKYFSKAFKKCYGKSPSEFIDINVSTNWLHNFTLKIQDCLPSPVYTTLSLLWYLITQSFSIKLFLIEK